MDDLRASYKDDDDIESVDTAPPPPSAAAVDERKDHTEPDSEPETEHQVSSEELLSEENENPSEQNGQIETKNSPNFTRASETDEDEEEYEEEPPAKKQKQVGEIGKEESPSPVPPVAAEIGENPSETLTTPEGTKLASKSSSKKPKKKNKDVWTRPASRKGKKKKNNGHHNGNSNGDESDKVLITPVSRFPDKNDDNPEAKICLSKVYKAEKVELSEDRLSAGSIKGYRMVRATRGVVEGAWYFEIKVVHLGETGHTRLGWTLDKGDLQAPVGYDGNSFGYRDIDGCKVHKALREKYGEEGYKEGDVVGFYINLPEGKLYEPPTPRLVWYKGQRYATSGDTKEEPPKVVPGSEISFFKNGVCQGTAYTDLFGGRYYPAASMYTLPNQPNCTVKFNFGPNFEFYPKDFGGRQIPRPMSEVPYHAFDAELVIVRNAMCRTSKTLKVQHDPTNEKLTCGKKWTEKVVQGILP